MNSTIFWLVSYHFEKFVGIYFIFYHLPIKENWSSNNWGWGLIWKLSTITNIFASTIMLDILRSFSKSCRSICWTTQLQYQTVSFLFDTSRMIREINVFHLETELIQTNICDYFIVPESLWKNFEGAMTFYSESMVSITEILFPINNKSVMSQ